VFGGDITPDAAFSQAAQYFGDWHPSPVAEPPTPNPALAQKGDRVIVIDKPDAGQAAVALGSPTIRRGDKNYVIGAVANDVLGGGYSSRLNEEVRIKRGLSYGASSRLAARKDGGLFYAFAQTRNDAAPQVASLFKSEVARLAKDAIDPSELVSRKASLSGNYARSLETGRGLVSAVASLVSFDQPLSALNEYLPQVQKVTPAQAQKFAAAHLGADGSIVVVGDGRQFLPELKKEFPNVEVIPVDKLDLNRASLVKP
jgi:zinc protease